MRAVRLTHACGLNERVIGDAGTPLALDDDEARDLVEVHHLAVYDPVLQARLDAVHSDPVAREIPVVHRADAPSPDAVLDLADTAAAAQEPVTSDTETALKQPWTTASKATWIDWAVHLGADPAEAAGLTKNELMSRYGERM